MLILGAGTMGQQIGFVCAMHGYSVTFYDISDDVLNVSMKRVEKLGSAYFVPVGRITMEQFKEIMGRITATSDPQAAAQDADIISESVPEDPEIKAKVFAQFNALCPERTIFTTNTSLLMPSKFAQATGRPEKLVALHFHDLRANNVADVMPHPETDPAVTQLVHDFAVSIGQIAIMLRRENNGYAAWSGQTARMIHRPLKTLRFCSGLFDVVSSQAPNDLPNGIRKKGDRFPRGKRQIVNVRNLFQKFRGQKRFVHIFAQDNDPVVLDDVGVGVIFELAGDARGQFRAAGEGVRGHLHRFAQSKGDLVEKGGNGLVQHGKNAAVKLMRVNNGVDVRPFAINGCMHSGFDRGRKASFHDGAGKINNTDVCRRDFGIFHG